MCGRFTQTKDLESLRQRFRVAEIKASVEAAFNIAPTNEALAVLAADQGRILEALRWGLLPAWAKDAKQQPQPINAKSETAATSGMFKRLLSSRRCLVLADSFYEWGGPKSHRQPYRIQLKSGEPFAFAGLWDLWKDPASPDHTLKTFTLLTTSANELVKPIHDRMPVILPPDAEDAWLDPSVKDVSALLQPHDPARMELYAVSQAVNDARRKGPECIEPLRQLFG